MKDGKLVWVAYSAVCLCWGSTFLAVRIGVQEMPPILFTGIRFLIAGVIILIFAAIKGLPFPNRSRDFFDYSVIGLLLLFGANSLMALAQQWVNSGIAALLVATVPLFIALVEYFLGGGDRLNAKGWIGLITGFAGVGILIMGDGMIGSVNLFGILLLLLSSGCWAWGSVYSQRLKPSGSVVTHIGIQMLAGGSASVLLGLMMGEAVRFHPTAAGLKAMVYLVIFGSLVGYSSYIYVLQKWPASRAGTYAYVNPVIAVLLGTLIMDEKLTPSIIASMVIILLGVLLVQKSGGISKTSKPGIGVESEV